MKLVVDDETAAIYRQGCDLVIEALKKGRKKLEELPVLHLDVGELDEKIDLAKAAKLLLNDQPDFIAEERTRRGEHEEQSEGQLTIDEAIEGSEQEAAARILAREKRAALVALMPDCPEKFARIDGEITDNEIAAVLADAWDEIGWVDEHDNGRRSIGWTQHTTEAGDVVWCFVRGGSVPQLWYGVSYHDGFDPSVIAATWIGKPMFDVVRELWGFKVPEAVEAPTEDAPAVEEPAESVGDYVKRVRPAPEVGNLTGALLLGLYQAMFADDEAQATVEAHQNGVTDDELIDDISLAFRHHSPHGSDYGFNVTIGTEDAAQFVEVNVKITPPKVWTGKGKKKSVLEGEQLVAAVRAAFEIPGVLESTEGEPAPEVEQINEGVTFTEEVESEPAEAGAGVTDDDVLPF